MKPLLYRLALLPKLPLPVRIFGVAVACWITVMAVAQLFTYEKFPGVIEGLWQADSSTVAGIMAAAIVVCEVFSLPYLLSMQVTPLIRLVSLFCGWFVAVFWLVVALWHSAVRGNEVNQGYLGATVPLTNEWLVLGLSFVLAIGVITMTIMVQRSIKTA